MAENPDRTPENRSPNNDVILSGNVWRAVWVLAWPTAVNTLIITAYNVVNRIFVGRIQNATDALAAVGIGGTALMIQFAVTIGLSAGSAALVARFLGGREHAEADEATRQSLILSVIAGIITGFPLIFFAEPLVRAIGAQGNVAGIAADYTAVITWFSIPLFVYMIVTTLLRSAGDVITPLYAGAVSIAVNIVFDWLLIFGVGPFPQMGVHGAAIATGLSRVAGMIISLYYLKRSVLGGSMSHFRIHGEWFRRILNIGWPAAIQNLMWTTAYAGFMRILAFLPPGEATAAQAAVTVGITIESTAFMPGVAYGVAATPLVGQNLGAKNPDRAEHSGWVAMWQAVAIMSVVAVLFLVIPEQLAKLFTNDAAIVPLVASYLRINAIAEPLLAVSIVLRGALQGAGETRKPAWVTFITNWPLRLPLQWFLAIHLGYGAPGAWAAMSVSTIVSGILIAAIWKKGAWREVRV